MERIIRGARYNGPPTSAHGGYACGVLAGFVGTSARVSLRRPPPLDRPLDVRRMSQTFELCDGEAVIAQAERDVGDGLRIFSSRVLGREQVAAPWRPDVALVAPDGQVRPEFVWAALDCPGGWAVAEFQREPKILLGQLTATIIRPLPGGEPYVTIGWPITKEGRKCRAGTAILSTTGVLHAIGEEIWITVA